MKFTVAVIYGGEGHEHNISVLSAKNLISMIDRSAYDIIPVYITERGEWFIESEGEKISTFPAFLNGKGGFFKGGKILKVDLAVPILHGELGEDGVIAGALRAAHIKAVGCPTLAGALTSDKIASKLIAEAIGIPTAKWVFADCERCDGVIAKAEEKLSYPMFIKPSSLGSSIGISRVSDREEFCKAYKKAALLSERILIEEEIPFERELECAYLFSGEKHFFEIGEICLDGKFYDFERKYEKSTKTSHFSGALEIKEKVIAYSDALRAAIGIRGLSRLDFFLTESGEVYFNEINALPGMTKTSLYPLLTEKMGFSKGEFINNLIREALI